MDALYSCLKFIVRISLKVYFKKIEVTGLENIPPNTPLIITPNHQNAFLDALIIGSFSKIPLYFLTRSDVFTKWSRPIMKLLHTIPIYRIRDGYSSLHNNEAIFKSCVDLFENGKSILIFAEGNHGPDHYLRPLTKGAARLALQSQLRMNEELKILPAGLNYFSHTQPGSKVHLVFGKPVSVTAHIKNYKKNEGKGLINMRDVISEGMKSTLIIPENSPDYNNRKSIIFNDKNEDLTFKELRKVKGTGELLKDEKPSKHLLPRLLNPLPFLVISKVLKRVKDMVFHSSLKLSIGLILFPFWWILSFITLFQFFGIFWASGIVTFMIVSLLISYKW